MSYQLFDPLPAELCDALKADIAKRGIQYPIHVDVDGNILDGHHRAQIAAELGIDCPRVVRHDLVTEQQKIEHVLILNLARRHLDPIAKARAFAQLLELRGVKRGQGTRNDLTCATVAQVAAEVGIKERTAKRLLEALDLPEPEQAQVQAGEKGLVEALRQAKSDAKRAAAFTRAAEQNRQAPGQATVLLSDACAFLESLAPESVDLLLTDPPYSTDVEDVESFARSWVPLALSRVKSTGRVYICTGAYPDEMSAYLDILRQERRLRLGKWLVWAYQNTLGPTPTYDYKQNHHVIWYLYSPEAPPLDAPIMPEQFTVQVINAPDGRHDGRLHTWQKPDELAERLIRHSTTPGSLIIDPFAGTGTFLAAAARLGRTGVGCDIDPAMLDICEKRGIRAERSIESAA